MVTTMTISEIAKKISKFNSVLIFCHARPDGDTLSSGFALKKALKMLNIYADVVCADKMPEKFANLELFSEGFSTQLQKSYDAHVAVDCASESMIGSAYELFSKAKETFVIDHHVSNTRFAKYNCVIDEGANAINVYRLIVELGVEIDGNLASLLYLGICTDTGNFSHANTDKRCLEVASTLVGFGANPNRIYNSMFRNQSESRARLHCLVMSRMKLYNDGKLAVISILDEDLKKFGLESSVTEGFIDFPLSIASVEVAVSILQKNKESFKISFRSKYQVDVNEVASRFGGGGHVRASGAVINGIYEDVVDKLIFTVGNYL